MHMDRFEKKLRRARGRILRYCVKYLSKHMRVLDSDEAPIYETPHEFRWEEAR